LTNDTFKLDIERMRAGWYTDKYFTKYCHYVRNPGKTRLSLPRASIRATRPASAWMISIRANWSGNAVVHPPRR
jgi:hypothetical protein